MECNAPAFAAAIRPGTWGYFYEDTWLDLYTTPDFVWGEVVGHDVVEVGLAAPDRPDGRGHGVDRIRLSLSVTSLPVGAIHLQHLNLVPERPLHQRPAHRAADEATRERADGETGDAGRVEAGGGHIDR